MDLHYRILLTNDYELTVIPFQAIDEHDYNENDFFTDEDDFILRFDYEDEAIDWLNQNIKQDKIDERYRKTKIDKEDFLL